MRWRLPDSHEGGPPASRRSPPAARWSGLGVVALGALLGGSAGGFLVVGVTSVLKAGIDFAAGRELGYVVVVPLLGLGAAVLVLSAYGKAATQGLDARGTHAWRAFPPEPARADISSDVVNSAGEEERFPWRLAPIRTVAIAATVASGAAMGTEAPAAYLGTATGACLGDRGGQRWRRLLRPAAVAGGAAGVGALMGLALVGMAFMLELGRRRRAPLSAERKSPRAGGSCSERRADQTITFVHLVPARPAAPARPR